MLRELAAMLFIVLLHSLHDLQKTGQAVARFVGKIGTSKKGGMIVRSKHHIEWPATGPLGEQVVGGLVDLIQIGPLFAVDFYTHKILIDEIGDCFVFERLMFHNVTPMTGGVTDRKEYRFVFVARFV